MKVWVNSGFFIYISTFVVVLRKMLTESELNRTVVLLADPNKITRQKALQSLCNDLKSISINSEEASGDKSRSSIHTVESMLKIFADPAEKNRDLALTYVSMFITQYCTNDEKLDEILALLLPTFVQRLGMNDITEPSEEIRLKSVALLLELCRGKRLGLYLNEWISILKRTIVDPYPEVRKVSCELASKLSKECQEKFHMMSESLVKPLFETMKHQHAKVRHEAIQALGNVIRYGNNKSVEDCVSPLAQRFFDHTSSVRLAVINVIGQWMLELRDRYSYFHLLLPLLLTGYTDEIEEIRETTDSLWWDVGLKYEKENEEDLKDQLNFPQTLPKYPSDLVRPNVGCRELVKRNLIRILPAIRNDLTDWVVSGRVKSSQLLAILAWQAESTITQHLEDTLQVCSKALVDDEVIVREQVKRRCEIDCEVFCRRTR
jgi:dynein assembly factor 5